MKELKASKKFEIRFSEVDSMKVVWHGSYPVYFEDAREFFGAQYGLGYNVFIANKYFAPIVELNCKYKRPLLYGMNARIDITYRPTESAKIIFDYEIYDDDTETLMCEGHTVQVFMDMDYKLVLDNPAFYEEWKEKWHVLE